ncbi:MAG: ATP-binding protein [Candidatus Latescibacterota bacterium]
MLIQPLLDKLSLLRLKAFRQALEEQLHNPRYAELSFEHRLGLLVDRECSHRDQGRLHRRLKAAHLPPSATPEDVDLSPSRGVARAQWLELLQADWVRRHLNVILTGPTGVGKTYLAGALGYAVCRADLGVSYHRTSRLLRALELAKGDGSYGALLD